jgi:hypothetical protein
MSLRRPKLSTPIKGSSVPRRRKRRRRRRRRRRRWRRRRRRRVPSSGVYEHKRK